MEEYLKLSKRVKVLYNTLIMSPFVASFLSNVIANLFEKNKDSFLNVYILLILLILFVGPFYFYLSKLEKKKNLLRLEIEEEYLKLNSENIELELIDYIVLDDVKSSDTLKDFNHTKKFTISNLKKIEIIYKDQSGVKNKKIVSAILLDSEPKKVKYIKFNTDDIYKKGVPYNMTLN